MELPEPDSGMYPDDELGEALFTFGGMAEHLSGMLFKVPEGLVLRCQCDRCGGREEDLVEFGDEIPDGADEENPVLKERLQETVLPKVQTWTEEHEECETRPWSYRLPDRLVAFTEEVLDRAGSHLAETGILPPRVFLVTSQKALALQMPDVPKRSADFQKHIAELERQKYAIREYLRQESTGLLAATLVALAESGKSDREPVLDKGDGEVMCVQVAPPFSRAGLGPVQRSYDEDGAVSASMGSVQWSPNVGHHVRLDGLFAVGGGWGQEKVRKGRYGEFHKE